MTPNEFVTFSCLKKKYVDIKNPMKYTKHQINKHGERNKCRSSPTIVDTNLKKHKPFQDLIRSVNELWHEY